LRSVLLSYANDNLGDRSIAPAITALVNGMLSYSLDFDVTHADSSLHPSALVVPAALAVGEQVGGVRARDFDSDRRGL
jgi:2-methylcitrate dehydratase PrpD